MSTNAACSADLDLFSDDVLLDPYPTTPSSARPPPWSTCPTNDVYALTRYDAIRDALADTATFSSSAIGFNPMVNEALHRHVAGLGPAGPHPAPRDPQRRTSRPAPCAG